MWFFSSRQQGQSRQRICKDNLRRWPTIHRNSNSGQELCSMCGGIHSPIFTLVVAAICQTVCGCDDPHWFMLYRLHLKRPNFDRYFFYCRKYTGPRTKNMLQSVETDDIDSPYGTTTGFDAWKRSTRSRAPQLVRTGPIISSAYSRFCWALLVIYFSSR